jgi:RimJ/RimL family protein N-acetyltransferase
MKIITGAQHIIGPWVCERTGGTYSPVDSQTIGVFEDENDLTSIKGGILYDHYNGGSIAMHVAGEGSRWITRQLCWIAFDYPFNQLKVNVILGFVDSTNEKARRFDENLGFKLSHSIIGGGQKGDLLIYVMRRYACRFLNPPYAPKSAELKAA